MAFNPFPWIEAALPLISSILDRVFDDDDDRLQEVKETAGKACELLERGRRGHDDPALAFAAKLVTLSREFPFSVTSWGRTPDRNALVGGVQHSQHLAWTAADVVLDDAGLASSLQRQAERVGLEVIVEPDHIHFQNPRRRHSDG